MPPRVHTLALLLCFFTSLCSFYLAQAEEQAIHPESPTRGQQGDDRSIVEKHPIISGCAGGVLIGSIVPGLGNAVGCVVGGLMGWLVSDAPDNPESL
ncbi:MAG: glycine zipper domain-containing protein [Gammaproteobacteria bacterium]|nr:glycine zipper domain-containing protein [Gammaproteobacteria bacterium]